MKKLINSPEKVVAEMCSGIAFAHSEIALDTKYKILYKKNLRKDKVTLISGGGSGHEPAHAGFIGKGMLDAAVCGDVFASPSQIQVYKAIQKTAGDAGTLLIIKNYSGDIMNFKNGAYLASEDGIQTDYVKVEDDIAVNDSLYTVGRRGVAGTVFVHKIAGAAAERGLNLADVKAAAEKAAANVKSLGFALTSCTVPAKGTPTFSLAENEMEYGVGIHGEPGIRRETMLESKELAARMVSALCDELNLQKGNKTAVLVNGFGATPLMELYLFGNDVARELAEKGITIARTFVGNYMTSIDMTGASLSLLKLDDELEDLLGEPSDATAFHVDGKTDYCTFIESTEEKTEIEPSFAIETSTDAAVIGEKVSMENMIYLVDALSANIIANEVAFCELDSFAGDGDFGMSVAKGFRQLKREWKEILSAHVDNIGSFLDACSMIIMEHCGGASGPVWGSAFRAAAKSVGDKKALSAEKFAEMMQAAVKGIQSTGERSFGRGAVPGDKTLIDALVPCADAWKDCAKEKKTWKECFEEAAKAAVDGAEKTKDIVARMGRAGTVGERSLGHPDAGAFALGVLFSDLAEKIK